MRATETHLDGSDIFEVLEAIKEHAGLFILKNHLDYLYNFVAGYKFLASSTSLKSLITLNNLIGSAS